MEQKEIDELLANDEVKAILAEQYASKADLEAINSKKEQLLSEKKKLQEKYKALEEQTKSQAELFEQIGKLGYDPAEVLAQTIAGLENPIPASGPADEKTKKEYEGRMQVQKQTYEAKLASQSQEYERKLKEERDKVDHLTRGWNEQIVENTLNAEMDRIGVAPKHKRLLKDAFRNKAQVIDEDGVRSVLIANDEGFGISASDFFNNFKETEGGKEYILAAPSTGGGAPGGKGRHSNIDYAAERMKALQNKDSRAAVRATLAQWNTNK